MARRVVRHTYLCWRANAGCVSCWYTWNAMSPTVATTFKALHNVVYTTSPSNVFDAHSEIKPNLVGRKACATCIQRSSCISWLICVLAWTYVGVWLPFPFIACRNPYRVYLTCIRHGRELIRYVRNVLHHYMHPLVPKLRFLIKNTFSAEGIV